MSKWKNKSIQYVELAISVFYILKVFASSIPEPQKKVPEIFVFSMPRTFSHQQILPSEWKMLLSYVIGRLDGFKRLRWFLTCSKCSLGVLEVFSIDFGKFRFLENFQIYVDILKILEIFENI